MFGKKRWIDALTKCGIDDDKRVGDGFGGSDVDNRAVAAGRHQPVPMNDVLDGNVDPPHPAVSQTRRIERSGNLWSRRNFPHRKAKDDGGRRAICDGIGRADLRAEKLQQQSAPRVCYRPFLR